MQTAAAWRGQYGNGGVRAAGARRLFMDQVDLMDLMDNVGAPRDTPWVGGAAVGGDAGGRCAAGENKTN